MFNSNEYSWADIKITIGGNPITGIRALEYKVERTVTHIYGAGNLPHSRTKGNKKFSGKITLLQSEIEALELFAGPNKDITDLSFDVVVAYVQEGNPLISTDVLRGCDVTGYTKGMKQDDGNMEIDLDLMIGSVRRLV